jgi:hypothetical protein
MAVGTGNSSRLGISNLLEPRATLVQRTSVHFTSLVVGMEASKYAYRVMSRRAGATEELDFTPDAQSLSQRAFGSYILPNSVGHDGIRPGPGSRILRNNRSGSIIIGVLYIIGHDDERLAFLP